jgi:hypothetical protein
MPEQEITASLLTIFTTPNHHTITTKNHEQTPISAKTPAKR